MKLSAQNNANLTRSCLRRPKLAVVIIYEGRAAGQRAKYLYENLARDLRGKYDVNLNLWNLPILAISQIGQLASQVAAKAHVVILSLCGDVELPAEIREWIETWSQLITDNDPALVLLVNRHQTSKTRVAVDYLPGVANKLGIDFFAESGIVPEFDVGLPGVGNRQP
jgi:hypothetical protein